MRTRRTNGRIILEINNQLLTITDDCGRKYKIKEKLRPITTNYDRLIFEERKYCFSRFTTKPYPEKAFELLEVKVTKAKEIFTKKRQKHILRVKGEENLRLADRSLQFFNICGEAIR